MNHSLRSTLHSQRYLILLCLLLVIIVCGSSYVTFYQNARVMSEKATQTLESELVAARESVETYLQAFIENMLLWARQSIMEGLIEGDLDNEISEFLEKTAEKYPLLREVTCASASLTIVASTDMMKVQKSLGIPGQTLELFKRGDVQSMVRPAEGLFEIDVPILLRFDEVELIGVLRSVLEPAGLLNSDFHWWIALADPKGRFLVQRGPVTLDSVSPASDPIVASTGGDLVCRSTAIRLAPGTRAPEIRVAVARMYDDLYGQIDRMRLLVMCLNAALIIIICLLVLAFSHKQISLITALTRRWEETRNDLLEKTLQAERASRSKSEFLANISHELRTPLHGILSFAGIGMKKYASARPEKVHGYFERIHRSGKTLQELLDQLLDLAKLDAGKMSFQFHPARLGVLIEGVVDEFVSLVAEKQLEVDLRELHFTREVNVDSEKMMTVIRNLVSNAVKFSPPGGTIGIAMREEHGSVVVVSVRDQGPGIPAAEIEDVFQKFVQSSRTKTGAGGTGLGLSICREIVTAHRGRIWAESPPGGGAVLSFEIPFSLEAGTGHASPELVAQLESETCQPSG